jgi:hypothetical protein
MTPKELSEELLQYRRGYMNDRTPFMFVNGFDDQQLNLGFDQRHHRIINYKKSNYCEKYYSYEDEDIVINDSDYQHHNGIYCMNKVKNGWDPIRNILFDPRFIKWIETMYQTGYVIRHTDDD